MANPRFNTQVTQPRGQGLVEGIRKHRGPLGNFTAFPKEIIRTWKTVY